MNFPDFPFTSDGYITLTAYGLYNSFYNRIHSTKLYLCYTSKVSYNVRFSITDYNHVYLIIK